MNNLKTIRCANLLLKHKNSPATPLGVADYVKLVVWLW